jgi:C4-dicarboxylate transporter, DctQ subunit
VVVNSSGVLQLPRTNLKTGSELKGKSGLDSLPGNLLDKVIDAMAFASGGLILMLMLAVSADVCMRYFFSSPISNMQEIAQQSLLIITFLSASWVLKKEGHTSIDLVLSLLNPRARAWINAMTSVVAGIVCLVFCWYAFRVTLIDFQRHALVSTSLRIPYAAVFGIAPIGYFLLCLQFMRRAIAFRKKLKGTEDIPEAA